MRRHAVATPVQLVVQFNDQASAGIMALGGKISNFGSSVSSTSATAASSFAGIGNAAGLSFDEAANRWRTTSGQFATNAEMAAAGVDRSMAGMASSSAVHFNSLQVAATGALMHIGTIAVDVAGQAASAISGFVGSSITAASDFEAGMNNIVAVAGDSLGQAGYSVDDLQAKFLDLGATTQFSAAQAQEAATSLIKGGVAITDVMGNATSAALDLAAAGELNLGPAADIVAKQLGVWGSTGVTATQVANQLAQAANASVVNVDDMALGLANAGGSAKVAGVSFADLTQTMGLVSPSFSSAADAGTSVKTFLSRLIPTTADATAKFSELGLMFTNTTKIADFLSEHGIQPLGTDLDTLGNQFSEWATAQGWTQKEITKTWETFSQSKFYDVKGEFVGMAAASELLNGATANLSEEQKSLAFNVMFGSDAIRAAAAISEAGGEGFAAFGAAMASTGTAAEQAALRNQGFAFAMDSLKGTIETLQIVIGSALLPILTMLTIRATDAMNGILSFTQGILAADDPVAALVSAIDGVIPGFAGFIAGFQQAAQAAAPLISMVQANLLPVLGAVATVLGGAIVVALAGMAASFLAAAAPILGLVAVVSAVYIAFQNNFGGIRDLVTTALAGVVQVVTAVVASITTAWTAQGPQILGAVQSAWSGISTAISSVMAAVANVVSTGLSLITAFWTQNGDAITTGAATMFGQVVSIVGGVMSILGTVVSAALNAIAGFWQANGSTIIAVVSGVWGGLASLISGSLGMIQGVVQAVLAAINGDWAGAWAALGTAAQSAITGIVGYVSSTLGGLGALMGGILGGLSGIAGAAFSAVGAAVSDALGALQATAMGAWQSIVNAAGSALSGLVGMVSGVWASVYDATIGAVSRLIADTVGAFLQQNPQIVSNLISIQNDITAIWNAVSSAVIGVVTALVISVVAQWQALVGGVQAALSTVVGVVSGVWASVVQVVSAAGTAVLSAVQSAWNSVVGAVQSALAPMLGAISSTFQQGQSTVSTSMNGILNTITSVGKSFIGAAIAIGRDIISGIGKGIGDAAGSLVTAATGAVAGALGAAKNALDINSPSRVFAREVGSPMSEGMALGVAQGEGQLNIQMGSTISSAIGVGKDATVGAGFSIGKPLTSEIASGISAGGSGISKAVTTTIGGALSSATKSLMQGTGSLGGLTRATGLAGSVAAATATLRTELGNSTRALNSAVTQFSASADKAIDVIIKGVEAFSKLRGYEAVPGERIMAFASNVGDAVFAFGAQFVRVNSTLRSAVNQFAETAGKVVSTIGTGVDAFTKLRGYEAVPSSALASFTDTLGEAVLRFTFQAVGYTDHLLKMAGSYAEAASKVVSTIGAGVEAFAKLRDFAAVPQQAITDFVQALATTVNLFGANASNWTSGMLAITSQFAETASKVVGTLKAGVDGLNALRTFAAVPIAAMTDFVQGLATMVNLFGANAQNWQQELLARTAQFGDTASKVVGTLKTGVDGLNAIRDFAPVGIEAISLFVQALASMVNLFGANAQNWASGMLAATGQYADTASKVVALLGNGVDALNKVRDFVATPQAAIDAFATSLAQLVGRLVTTAQTFTTEALAAGALFGDTASKLLGLLGSGIDGLLKLSSFVAPSLGAMQQFAGSVGQLTSELLTVSARFAAEGLKAGSAFAETAGKLLGLLGSGVEGLNKLREFSAIPQAAMAAFVAAVHGLTGQLVLMAERFSTDGLKAGSLFADTASKVIGLLASGVEGLNKLREFQAVGPAAIYAFSSNVALLVLQIGQFTDRFTSEGLKAASAFAETAGKVVGILGSGVEGFTKLASFRGVAPAAILSFGVAIDQAVTLMAQIASRFSAEALKAASLFAETASKVIGVIGSGVDAFGKLRDFKAVPQQAIAAFGMSLDQAVTTLVSLAATFRAEALDAAGLFLSTASSSISLIGSAIDVFKKLASFKGVPEAAVSAFAGSLTTTLNTLRSIASTWSAEGIAAARQFAENATAIIRTVADAMNAFATLAKFKSSDYVATFAAALRAMIAAFQNIAVPAAGNLGASIGGGIAGGLLGSTGQVNNATGQVVATVRTRLTETIGVVRTVTDAMRATFQSGLSPLPVIMGGVLGGVTRTTQSGMSQALSMVRGATNEMQQSFRSGLAPLPAIAGAALGGVTRAVQGSIAASVSAVRSGMGSIVGEVRSAAGSITGAATLIGRNISAGIASGIRAGAGTINTAAKNAANTALVSAKQSLGIHSPSRVAAAQIGLPFTQGIAVGVLSNLRTVEQAASSAARAMIVSPPLLAAAAGRPPAFAPTTGGRPAAAAPVPQKVVNLTVHAHYANTQDARTLRDDLEAFAMSLELR